MFERIISIDWAGASTETKSKGVGLRVAVYDTRSDFPKIQNRQVRRHSYKSWSRADCRDWIAGELKCKRPTLVAMDFGFGLPWNSHKAFCKQAAGWRRMVEVLARLYKKHKKSKATAEAINNCKRFQGSGPFRIDDDRTDYSFYLQYGVGYYRLTELIAPQAISQWYFGPYALVGSHTITGLSTLHDLMTLREHSEIDFDIWPHETLAPDGSGHVLAESYPSLSPPLRCYYCSKPYEQRPRKKQQYIPRKCGACHQDGPWTDEDQEDAWRVLMHLVTALKAGKLSEMFRIPETPFGRCSGVDYWQQIQFEGFILGMN